MTTNGKLHMPRHNTVLLVITGGVNGEFENLSGEVLEDCSEIYWREASKGVVEELKPKVANLEHQYRRAERSFPSSTDDVYD